MRASVGASDPEGNPKTHPSSTHNWGSGDGAQDRALGARVVVTSMARLWRAAAPPRDKRTINDLYLRKGLMTVQLVWGCSQPKCQLRHDDGAGEGSYLAHSTLRMRWS